MDGSFWLGILIRAVIVIDGQRMLWAYAGQ